MAAPPPGGRGKPAHAHMQATPVARAAREFDRQHVKTSASSNRERRMSKLSTELERRIIASVYECKYSCICTVCVTLNRVNGRVRKNSAGTWAEHFGEQVTDS